MPPYDCMLLFKPNVKKEALIGLVSRIGKHVCKRNGVVTEVKSFGTIQLGYGVKKRDGRFYQGQMMQVSMMATPEINKELHYLNKEDKLLRWLLVKQRDTKIGLEFMGDEGRFEPNRFSVINKDDGEDSDTDGDDDEYEVNEERK
uniref:Ribosomal protein S6 n=1 Tax=Medicago truncatula TaxID=3880 RepID=I3SXN3_MEDTR|nr:unknown [Medicago truncatula]